MRYNNVRFSKRSVLAIVLCVSLILSGFWSFGKADTTIVNATTQTGTVTVDGLNVRKSASTSAERITSLSYGTVVTILKTKTTKANGTWYKISTKVDDGNGTTSTVKGFVYASYIKLNVTVIYTRYANTKNQVKLFTSQSTKSAKAGTVVKGQLLKVSGKKKVSGVYWYKATTVGLTYNITGYIKASKITLQPVSIKNYAYNLYTVTKATTAYTTANDTGKTAYDVHSGDNVIYLGMITVGGTKWIKIKNEAGKTGYALKSCFKKNNAKVTSSLNYDATIDEECVGYKIASTISDSMGKVSANTSVKVKGQITVDSVKWYKVRYKNESGTTVTGYIQDEHLTLSTDAIFEQNLKNFPSSYRSALKALHKAHPLWIFNAVDTGLSWDTVIANESKSGVNTIQSGAPKGNSSSYSAPFSYLSTESGDYDWSTDTYKAKDGTLTSYPWYTANSAVISYYMDPRNFLTDKGIFQFESLSYESTQTESVAQSMLDSTFMKGSYSVTDVLTKKKVKGKYVDAFMDAGKLSNTNPYYLISKVIGEVGVNGSNSTTGTYGNYVGYYNFFNIGAYDGSDAVASGLKYASSGTTYERPWTTPYKSIVGGAKYVATTYIAKGQNTAYTQKFNVTNTAALYSHQYMTAVTAANSTSLNQYNSYNKYGILDQCFTFNIPVYNDMPDTVCALPESKGNPNNYLSSLKVVNGVTQAAFTLDKTFNYKTTSYTLNVASTVKKVSVSATKISSYATVTGASTYTLSEGENVIKIKVTAGSGSVRTYKITINKASAEE